MADETIHVLTGPTASGKESVALDLAAAHGAEILLLDSMKVYRGLSVGTAKATPAQRARVPHHLLDLADPSERFSARRWLTAAEDALADIRTHGRRPLFVGGTALYLKTLLYGLFEGPEARPDLRFRLMEETGEELHRRLQEVDPVTAARVHPNDRRRLVRALEVFEVTGRPVSEFRKEWARARPRHSCLIAGIRRDRADLYSRIDRRVDRMLDAGLVDEVRGLLADAGTLGDTARQALGYKEIAEWLEGTTPDLDEALRILKSRTRIFARRQLTWFRHFPIEWVDAGPDSAPEDLAAQVAGVFGW